VQTSLFLTFLSGDYQGSPVELRSCVQQSGLSTFALSSAALAGLDGCLSHRVKPAQRTSPASA
jgi:hypothetical protein